MFRFENPICLYLLLAVPLLWLAKILASRARMRKLRRFGDPSLLAALSPDVSRTRREVKFWLMALAYALAVVMLARPQMGTNVSQEKRSGIEVMICVDVSNSMRATDVVPSRLDKAKLMMENLVDDFTDDKIGLVVFAGDAFTQMPMTADYVSAKMFLHNISTSLIALQGTDIGEALRIAQSGFSGRDRKVGRAIIVITDGEDHEGGAVEAARAAAKAGVHVFVLGVGSPQGAPIPEPGGGYMRDRGGEVVMTALNEEMCREVAAAGSGAYIHVDNTSMAQRRLGEEISKLQRGEISSVTYSEYGEQFQAVGILLALVLALEAVVLEGRNPLLGRLRLFK